MKPHSSIQSSIFLRSIFFIGMLSISLTSYSQWFPMNPGGGGVFTSINIGPSGDIIATSDLGGAYHSKDDGISWEPIGSLDGMTMTHLQSVIFHPSNENTIFLSGDRGTGSANETGISKSINNGVTFDPVTINFAPGFNSSNAVVKSLAIAPSNPNVVYASIRSSYNKTDSRIYKSVDAGTTFNEMSDLSNTTNPAIIKLVVHPANEDVVLALSYKDRFTKDNPFQTPALPLPSYTLLLSQDGGTNWQQVILDRPSSEIYDVVFNNRGQSKINPDGLFAII